MKEEYDVNGKKFVVEDGGVSINGTKVLDHLEKYQMTEIKNSLAKAKEFAKKNNISPAMLMAVQGYSSRGTSLGRRSGRLKLSGPPPTPETLSRAIKSLRPPITPGGGISIKLVV